MHESMRHVAIVGEEQETFGLFVQATNMEEPLWVPSHKISHTRASLIVGHGGHNAGGLVQHEYDHCSDKLDYPAVKRDLIARGIDACAQIGNDAVHSNAPSTNQRITCAARPNPSLRQRLLQPNAVITHISTVDLYFTVRRQAP